MTKFSIVLNMSHGVTWHNWHHSLRLTHTNNCAQIDDNDFLLAGVASVMAASPQGRFWALTSSVCLQAER